MQNINILRFVRSLSLISLMQFKVDWRQKFTSRPASADRTARRQFQATSQPVSRTQASDAHEDYTEGMVIHIQVFCHTVFI